MTRAELYALVWERPVVQIAQQFGISNAGLRKICDDYNIPVPPAGYWTKRAYGKPVQQPPLPELAPSLLRKINVALRRMGEMPLRIATAQLESFDLKFGGSDRLLPNAAPERLHPKAEALEQRLRQCARNQDGFVICEDASLPRVMVGPASIERAARLFGDLAGGIVEAGYSLVENEYGLCIVADGEVFSIAIYEARDREIIPPSRESVARRATKSPPSWRRVPSGRLRLVISDPRPFRWGSSNRAGVWYDLRGRPVENCVGLAVSAIAVAAASIKLARENLSIATTRHDRESELQRIADERLNRTKRETEFLMRKAEAHERWLKLSALAERLSDLGDGIEPPVQRMIVALREAVDEMGREFQAESLNSELLRLALFIDDA